MRGTRFYGTAIQRNAIQLHSRRNFISPKQTKNSLLIRFPCCKLLNGVWIHFEDLGILEHSEKLSVLP